MGGGGEYEMLFEPSFQWRGSGGLNKGIIHYYHLYTSSARTCTNFMICLDLNIYYKYGTSLTLSFMNIHARLHPRRIII